MTFDRRWKKEQRGKAAEAQKPKMTPPEVAVEPPRAEPTAQPLKEAKSETVPEQLVDEPTALLHDSVKRLYFRKVLGMSTPNSEGACECGEHAGGYVWGLGKKPRRRGLAAVADDGTINKEEGDIVFSQLAEIMPVINAYALDLEEGPYADMFEQMGQLGDMLFAGVQEGDMYMAIERIIDMRPMTDLETEMRAPRMFEMPFKFVMDPEFRSADILPTAGSIFAQEKRVGQNETTGGAEFCLTNVIEPYMLAVSLLRRRGFNAYIADGVIPVDGEELRRTLIAIVDMSKEVPLTTFNLIRDHPPMGALDILSDVAVQGAAYALQAEAQIKQLSDAMVLRMKDDGEELSMEEMEKACQGIARLLYRSYSRWPKSRYIDNALLMMMKEVSDALFSVVYLKHVKANGEEVAERIGMLSRQILMQGIEPESIDPRNPLEEAAKEMAIDALRTAENTVKRVRHMLRLVVAKSPGATE